MHKHTGLTCQSQISRQQQSVLLSIPGQAWYPGTSLGPRLDSKPFLTLSPSHLGCQLKPLTADWDLNPCAGTQTQPKPSFGLKPTWLGIEPSKNPAWDLNPRGWDSVSFSCSVISDSVTPWTAVHQASLSITNSQRSLKLMSIELVMPSNHLILCGPLLFLPSIFPSIRVFSNKSALRTRWPKYWSFSFCISLSNEHLGLISFRMDWLDLLAVQGTFKSLLQHHSSKASIFDAQLSL